jgi:hypothetical protein
LISLSWQKSTLRAGRRGWGNAEKLTNRILSRVQNGHDAFKAQACTVYERLGRSDIQLRVLRCNDCTLDQTESEGREIGAIAPGNNRIESPKNN